MLCASLFPRSDGGQSPHIGHLLVAVDMLHQVVIIIMCHLLTLTSPDDELRGIGEITARDVGRRVSLCPCDDIQNLVAQLRQAVGDRENIVVSTGNPNRTVFLQLVPA